MRRLPLNISLFVFLGTICSVRSFGFSYERLVTLIGDRIRDIPTLLGELPAPLTDAYVGLTVTGNEEDHDADGDDPRIFIFDDDGKFLLSFDGQDYSRSIQIAQYRDETETVELRQVTFPEPGKRDPVRFSKPNLKTCLKCHQPDARWIWHGEYPDWKQGLIGRYEDGFAPGSSSLESHLAFKRRAKNHERYRHLGQGGENSPHPFHIYDPKLGKYSPGRSLRTMPNTRLTLALNRLNARRVFKLLKRNAVFYAKYRHALAYVWSNNLSATNLAPPGTAAQTCVNVDSAEQDDRSKIRFRQLGTIADEIFDDYAKAIPKTIPASSLPERSDAFSPENIFYILGLDTEKDVSLGDPKIKYAKIPPFDYWDGLTDLRSLLLHFIWQDIGQTDAEFLAYSNFRNLAKVTGDLARNQGLTYYRKPGYFPPTLMATLDRLSLSLVEPRLENTTFLGLCDKLRLKALTDMGKPVE